MNLVTTTISRVAYGLVVIALALVTLPVVFAGPVHAADNGAWSVTPTPPDVLTPTPRNYFVLEAQPGQTLKDSVRIKNFTDKPITFEIYGADGYNTRQSGFFALKGLDEPQIDVGGWIRMPIRKLKVAAKTQADVPFTIKIPENASPGDHVGGVVALNTAIEGTQDAGSIDIGVRRAVGARLYLRVAGPLTPDVSVTDVRLDHDRGWLPWSGSREGTVSYTVQNTGNTRLSPESTVELTGLFGRDIDKATAGALVDLLPGQTVTMTQAVSGIGIFDRVTTSVTLEAEEGIGDSQSVVDWIVPWLLLALLLIVLAGGLRWWQRRRAAPRRGADAVENAPRITVSAGQ